MINAAGVGSGIDINGLVKQLVEAEGAPKTALYAQREATLQAKISGFGTLKSALSELRSAISALKLPSSFEKRSAVSSNGDLFTATATSSAAIGSYEIVVDQLAEAHKLSTAGFENGAAAIGTGSLTISSGDASFSLSIGASNNSLAGIRDAINKDSNNNFLTATLVNVDADGGGTETRLLLSAKTAGQPLQISVEDDDHNDTDANGLSQLAFVSGGTENLEEIQANLPAIIHIDGQIVTSETNTVKNAIDGVTINLIKADDTETNTLTMSADTNAVTAAVSKFVGAYNNFSSTLKSLSRYESADQAGVLVGDATLRNLEGQLRREFSTRVGSDLNLPRSLAELGVTTGDDGSLSFDSSKLTDALKESPQAITDFFSGDNGFAKRLDVLADNYLRTGGVFETRSKSLNAQVDAIDNSRERLSLRLVSVERRLRAQFTAMDSLVSSLNNTSSFLQQQLSTLDNINRQISNRG